METKSTTLETHCSAVDVRAYGDYTTDIGNSINLAIQDISPIGGEICLPAGTYPCLTPIDLSVNVSNQTKLTPITISGRGWSPSYPAGGAATIIDGEQISEPVIRFDPGPHPDPEATHRYNITLRDFTLRAGAGMGICLINCPLSRLEHISVLGAGDWGFYLKSNYNSVFSQLYAPACNKGIKIEDFNAGRASMLTARECTNPAEHAMLLLGGDAFSIDTLYVEANYGPALSISGQMFSAEIGPIYLEGNNRSNQSGTDEVSIGDCSVSQSTPRLSTINGIFFNSPSKDPSTQSVNKFRRSLAINRAHQLIFKNLMFSSGRSADYAIKSSVDTSTNPPTPQVSGKLTFMNVDLPVGETIDCETALGNVWIQPEIHGTWTNHEKDFVLETPNLSEAAK